MKKIWICGVNGMVGSHIKRLLDEKKIHYLATNRQEADITDLETVSDIIRIQKVTHVINCAAYTKVDQAENEQKEAYQVNALGTHNLGIAGRRHGARVMHFSTDYVFDGRARFPYVEEDILSPIGAYGISKMVGEVKLLEEHSHACIIRTSWLFGHSGKNFVKTMLNLMTEKEELMVVSDQIGRPTYCQDLAEITLQLLEEEGIFHFANSHETSWYNFAEEIYRQAQPLGFDLKVKNIHPIATHEYPTPAKRPLYTTLNTNKIENILGKSIRPWQEALKDYLIYLKNHQPALNYS